MEAMKQGLTPSEIDDPKAYRWIRELLVRDLEARWGTGWEQVAEPLQPGNGHDGVLTSQTDLDAKAKRQRAKEMFLTGFLTDSFSQRKTGEFIRIVAETGNTRRRQIFNAVLSEWGEVISRPTLLRTDVKADKLDFLRKGNSPDAVGMIVGNKQDFAAYFAGLWGARDFLYSLRLPSQTPEVDMVRAFEEYYGSGLIKSGKPDRERRLLLIADPKGTITTLLRTESVASLPFVDQIYCSV